MSKLTFYYAAMASGKSTHLLQQAYNHTSQGMGVVLLTAQLDDRFGVGRITSRLGISSEAKTYTTDTVMDASLLKPDTACLYVEECQFMSARQAQDLHKLAHQSGIPVACYGLRSDFRGLPFAGSAMLLTLADKLVELETVCACSKQASMNARLEADGRRTCDGDQIEIGNHGRYRSMCPSCFYATDATRAMKGE